MKILHLFDFFSPHGGATVDLLYKLSRALAQKGHEVEIFTSDFKLDRQYIGSLPEVKVHSFHCASSAAQFYLAPGLVGEVKRRLKDFDIVHLHCFRSFQNIVIRHYAKKYGIPYVLDTHGSLPRAAGGKRGVKWLLGGLFDATFGYRILRDASKLIAETEVGVSEYRELGAGKDKIVLIPPPFAIEDFSKLPPPSLFRQKYNIKEKHIVIFLGRIHWIKGLDFLVESFYELTKSRNDVILVIVGNDDGYRSTLESQIEALNLSDKVLFTGFLGGTDKLSALVDADVMVQTSVYEQGAWAPFEAILCNTPIIVSNNSGAGEDVKKIDAGYLVEYGNKNELQETIQYVLDNSSEARNKTQKAKEYIESNRSFAKGVEEYEKLYAEVIEEVRKE